MEGEDDLPPPPLHDVLKTTKNINVYRTLTLLRIGCLFFLLKYRFSYPLQDNAYLIWFLAGCCEVMFVLNFLAYTILKWRPVERKTYLDRLSSRYEKTGEPSKLHPVDVFITTAEPWKEPPMVTANTILSVLSVDYPVDKVTCYVSDDSASPITFSMMLEVSKFDLKWVPFCKKFSIEPRAPAAFFSSHTEEASASEEFSDFNRQWKALKQEYEKLKIRVNGLAKNPEQALKFAREHTSWSTDNPRDHPAFIEIGWRYGSSAEDLLTGFKIHCLGWRSIYFWPTRPAFKGVAPATAVDRLTQRKRIACGLVNVLLCRSSPLFYGFQRLMFLQRIAYIYNCMSYAGISVLVVLNAILHAACLLAARSLTPQISDPESIWFLSAMCFLHGMSFLEYWWASDASFQQWWDEERFWWISNASCFLLGTLEAFFISIGLVETGFSITPKSSETDNATPYAITASPLFIPLVMLVMMSSVATVTAATLVIKEGTEAFNCMCGELVCGMWSLVILNPILSGLLKERKGIDMVPLSVVLPSVIGTIILCIMVNIYA